MDCNSYCIEYGTPRCMGTKEMEPCYCNGNTDSCSFYPEKRKPHKLNTAEMWLEAQKTGRQYQAGDVLYSKETGLVYADDFNLPWTIKAWASYDGGRIRLEFDDLMSEEWTIVPIPTMTKSEAEATLGVKIVD